MSFDAHQDTISRLLNNSIYRIPRNQRSYVWGERNWSDLDKDVMLVVDGVSSSHFIGSVVLKSEGDDAGLPVYTVIDGQQRLITLTVAIVAILYELKRRRMTSDATGTVKYLQATDDSGEPRIIVSTGTHLTLGNLAKSIIGMNDEEIRDSSLTSIVVTATADRKRDANIVKAFRFFVQELGKKDDEILLLYRNAVIGVQYVRIASTTEEDSYTIFEILNARGMELEDHELLKNYIMRYISPKEKRDDAKQVWTQIEDSVDESMKDFLRHYAVHRYKFSSSDKEGVYKKIRDYADPRNAEVLLRDIKLKAGYYSEIAEPDSSKEDGAIFTFFKSHRIRVYRPLLLSLMHRRELESITEDEYIGSLRFLRAFHICYKVIAGFDSNRLTDSIAKHAFEIEAAFEDSSLKSWKDSFNKKLPTKDEMEDLLLTLGWSSRWDRYEDSSNKSRCKLVLGLLEEAVSGYPASSEFTIEHILPDSQERGNALVGNMLPLESRLNKLCADKPLADKLTIYAGSNYASTRSFAKRYSKQDFEIKIRTKHMADTLYESIVEASGIAAGGSAK